MPERWTVLKILRWTADYFRDKGIDSPRLDAELLLADTLAMDRVGVYLHYDRPLSPEELAAYRSRVRRRADHEPVQYILGESEFWSLALEVGPEVLIPRPDTEVLVEEVLARITEGAHLLDVGTGSGAIALAVAHEKPDVRVTAIDNSPAALRIARRNAERHGLADRIRFLEADLARLPDEVFDLVVSNPPYVAAPEWDALMPEVRCHEPRSALYGGVDGLDAYRHLSRQAVAILRPGGWLLVEVGATQATVVATMLQKAGLTGCGVRKDYADLPRVVYGKLSEAAE